MPNEGRLPSASWNLYNTPAPTLKPSVVAVLPSFSLFTVKPASGVIVHRDWALAIAPLRAMAITANIHFFIF